MIDSEKLESVMSSFDEPIESLTHLSEGIPDPEFRELVDEAIKEVMKKLVDVEYKIGKYIRGSSYS